MNHFSPRNAIDPVIAVPDTHASAEAAVKALARAGFDMARLSVVGRGSRNEDRAVGFYARADRLETWGGAGGFWGAIWRLLDPAVFFIPKVGIVAMGGPIALAFVQALEGAVVVGGASALAAALASLGMPIQRALQHEADLRTGRLLIIVHGDAEDIAKARAILAAMSTREDLPIASAH